MLNVIMNMNDCSREEARDMLKEAIRDAQNSMNSGTPLEEAVEQVKEAVSVYEADWDMKIANLLCYSVPA